MFPESESAERVIVHSVTREKENFQALIWSCCRLGIGRGSGRSSLSTGSVSLPVTPIRQELLHQGGPAIWPSDCPGTKSHVRGPHQTNNSFKLSISAGDYRGERGLLLTSILYYTHILTPIKPHTTFTPHHRHQSTFRLFLFLFPLKL